MAGLNELIQRLERFENGEVYQRIGTAIANACHAQCLRGFQQERDPYGTPWAPRKPAKAWAVKAFGLIDNGHKLLDDTGAMINSLRVRYVRGTVLMKIKGYAKYHQSGTRYMTARKIFPDGSGLGTWEQPIQDAATNAVREMFR